jgi:hypothetical protein
VSVQAVGPIIGLGINNNSNNSSSGSYSSYSFYSSSSSSSSYSPTARSGSAFSDICMLPVDALARWLQRAFFF